MIENRAAELAKIVNPFFAAKMTDGPTVLNHRGERVSASYGLECSGYDVRLREPVQALAGYMVYGVTLEHFQMPFHLMGRVESKSTNNRLGIGVDGKLEPGWHGNLTVEIVLTPRIDGPSSIILPAGWGIASIVFYELIERRDYGTASPNPKYQGDTDVRGAA